MKIYIMAKCSDLCSFKIEDQNIILASQDQGYVPEGLGLGGGDYLEIEVDVDSGKILNWNRGQIMRKIDLLAEMQAAEKSEEEPDDTDSEDYAKWAKRHGVYKYI